MIAALCVFLPLIYSPSPALTQLNHANQKKLQPLSRMPSSPVNHSQAPKGAESGNTGFHAEIANETLEPAEATKFLSFPEEGAGAMGFQSTLGASECAHIPSQTLLSQLPPVKNEPYTPPKENDPYIPLAHR